MTYAQGTSSSGQAAAPGQAKHAHPAKARPHTIQPTPTPLPGNTAARAAGSVLGALTGVAVVVLAVFIWVRMLRALMGYRTVKIVQKGR